VFTLYDLVLGSHVRSRELNSILMGPFQLELFYDPMMSVEFYPQRQGKLCPLFLIFYNSENKQ